jgi:hypothetical protein
MGERLLFLLISICFTHATSLAASQNMGIPQYGEALGGYLLWGPCEMADYHDAVAPKGPIFCIRGKVGGESVLSSGPSNEDLLGKYADGNIGIYIFPWFSLYGRARTREFRKIVGDTGVDAYRDVEYAAVNFGSPSQHKFRMMLGQMRPPFGIDRPDVDEFYRLSEDRRFWPGPTSSVALTLDDLRATEMNLGLARYRSDLSLEKAILKGDYHDVVTLRFMRDFAGSGGTRLILSGGIDSTGARLYGVGFVNQAPNSDQLQFEVVRRLPQPDGRESVEESLSQIIRLGFIGHFDHDARWIFHLDDEKYRFRRGLLEFNYRLENYLIARVGTIYRIDIVNGANDSGRWNMISGFEVRL